MDNQQQGPLSVDQISGIQEPQQPNQLQKLSIDDISRQAAGQNQHATPGQFDVWMHQAANTSGVPYDMIKGVIHQESGFDPTATNKQSGAEGLGQFMPGTAKALGINPYDPQQAINGVAKYLLDQYSRFHNWDDALAAYNAGPGNVAKYHGVPPFKETQAYVKNIMAWTHFKDTHLGDVRKNLQTKAPTDFRIPRVGATIMMPAAGSWAAEIYAHMTPQMLHDAVNATKNAVTTLVDPTSSAMNWAAGKFDKEAPASIKNPTYSAMSRAGEAFSSLGYDFWNAGLEDLAEPGGNKTIGVGPHLQEWFGDWSNIALALNTQNFADAGKWLDIVSHRYGPNEMQEMNFWADKPGFADALHMASPGSIGGNWLQLLMGAHADAARMKINGSTMGNHNAWFSGLIPWGTAAETDMLEMLNIGNFIPGGKAGLEMTGAAREAEEAELHVGDIVGAARGQGGKAKADPETNQMTLGVNRVQKSTSEHPGTRFSQRGSNYFTTEYDDKKLNFVENVKSVADPVAVGKQMRKWGWTVAADNIGKWAKDIPMIGDRFRRAADATYNPALGQMIHGKFVTDYSEDNENVQDLMSPTAWGGMTPTQAAMLGLAIEHPDWKFAKPINLNIPVDNLTWPMIQNALMKPDHPDFGKNYSQGFRDPVLDVPINGGETFHNRWDRHQEWVKEYNNDPARLLAPKWSAQYIQPKTIKHWRDGRDVEADTYVPHDHMYSRAGAGSGVAGQTPLQPRMVHRSYPTLSEAMQAGERLNPAYHLGERVLTHFGKNARFLRFLSHIMVILPHVLGRDGISTHTMAVHYVWDGGDGQWTPMTLGDGKTMLDLSQPVDFGYGAEGYDKMAQWAHDHEGFIRKQRTYLHEDTKIEDYVNDRSTRIWHNQNHDHAIVTDFLPQIEDLRGAAVQKDMLYSVIDANPALNGEGGTNNILPMIDYRMGNATREAPRTTDGLGIDKLFEVDDNPDRKMFQMFKAMTHAQIMSTITGTGLYHTLAVNLGPRMIAEQLAWADGNPIRLAKVMNWMTRAYGSAITRSAPRFTGLVRDKLNGPFAKVVSGIDKTAGVAENAMHMGKWYDDLDDLPARLNPPLGSFMGNRQTMNALIAAYDGRNTTQMFLRTGHNLQQWNRELMLDAQTRPLLAAHNQYLKEAGFTAPQRVNKLREMSGGAENMTRLERSKWLHALTYFYSFRKWLFNTGLKFAYTNRALRFTLPANRAINTLNEMNTPQGANVPDAADWLVVGQHNGKPIRIPNLFAPMRAAEMAYAPIGIFTGQTSDAVHAGLSYIPGMLSAPLSWATDPLTTAIKDHGVYLDTFRHSRPDEILTDILGDFTNKFNPGIARGIAQTGELGIGAAIAGSVGPTPSLGQGAHQYSNLTVAGGLEEGIDRNRYSPQQAALANELSRYLLNQEVGPQTYNRAVGLWKQAERYQKVSI